MNSEEVIKILIKELRSLNYKVIDYIPDVKEYPVIELMNVKIDDDSEYATKVEDKDKMTVYLGYYFGDKSNQKAYKFSDDIKTIKNTMNNITYNLLTVNYNIYNITNLKNGLKLVQAKITINY